MAKSWLHEQLIIAEAATLANTDIKLGRPVRLADVVLVLMQKKDGALIGEMKNIMMQLAYLWDCFHDDLTLQSEECVRYIAGELEA